MTSIDPIRTAHVGFTVHDLDGAIAMFTDLFGYEVISLAGRHPKGVARLTGVEGADIMVAHLSCDGLLPIELIQYRAARGGDRTPKRPCDDGFAHLTFDVPDLDIAIEAAAAHGLLPIGELVGSSRDGRTPPRVVYLRDGNGIHIELVQPA